MNESIDPAWEQQGNDFPAIIEIAGSDDWSTLLCMEASHLLDVLGRHGALLIRGLPIKGAKDFDAAVRCFDLPNFTYADSLSNAVRRNLSDRVFTANEAPAEVSIYLHHEMAQTPIYPSKLFFCCEQAAESGGETPLCRSDLLLERLNAELPEFVADCISKGGRYSNTMPADDDSQSGQGRSWRSTLSVDSREEAEKKLDDLNYSWQWLEDDLRVTTPALPLVRELGDGRRVFFNQLIAAHRGWKDARNAKQRAVVFGDGSEMPESALQRSAEIADELCYDLVWQAGDIVLVDNFLVLHGRRPFAGSRRVLASLVA